MQPKLIQTHRQAIAELCRTSGVRRLELFGSAARGDFSPGESDFDFFVEFEPNQARGAFKRYMNLKLSLEELLGHSVDLIERSAVQNCYFLQIADQHREELYAA